MREWILTFSLYGSFRPAGLAVAATARANEMKEENGKIIEREEEIFCVKALLFMQISPSIELRQSGRLWTDRLGLCLSAPVSRRCEEG